MALDNRVNKNNKDENGISDDTERELSLKSKKARAKTNFTRTWNKAIHFSWLGPELSSVACSTGAQLIIFFCIRFSVMLLDRPGISIRHAAHCICRFLVFASS